jgi:uncharacterized protein YbaR (Trm112 family)
VHIELTDHLRCPSPHAESFLVLLPGTMDRRRVVSGTLGCPVCGRVFEIKEGIAEFGESAPSSGRTALTAEALAAFLGLTGPGGYLALAGGVTALGPDLGRLLPGVGLALVNPPPGAVDSTEASVLRAGRLPIKASSLRGIALGADVATDSAWVADAVRAVLPGLRIVGEGGGPPPDGIEVLARSGQCWVGIRRR